MSLSQWVKAELAIALLLLPFFLSWLPFIWYGKRHGWDVQQYRWVSLGTIVFWSFVWGIWVSHLPLSIVLAVAVLLFVPMTLLIVVLNRTESARRNRIRQL